MIDETPHTRFTMSDLLRPRASPAENRRKLCVALLLGSFAVAAAFQFQPTYVVVDIPVTPHRGSEFWWERQRSERAFSDESGVSFVYRQVGTAYPETQGWKTVGEAFDFFDQKLKERGWPKFSPGFDDPVLPESRFLAQANMRRYHQPDDRESGSISRSG